MSYGLLGVKEKREVMLMTTNIICIDFGLVVTLSKSDLNEEGFLVKKKEK